MQGTISLVKNRVYGTFNTVSKITGAVSGGLATLTLDDEYIMQRQRTRLTERPKHVGEGLLYGAKDLGRGVVEGVTGIVTQPIKGAQEDGAVGFAKGVGKGLVGYGITWRIHGLFLLACPSNRLWVLLTLYQKQQKVFDTQQPCLKKRHNEVGCHDMLEPISCFQ